MIFHCCSMKLFSCLICIYTLEFVLVKQNPASYTANPRCKVPLDSRPSLNLPPYMAQPFKFGYNLNCLGLYENAKNCHFL